MIACVLLLAAEIAAAAPGRPNRQPQLAARGNRVAVAYGAGNGVYLSVSTDGGRTFGPSVLVSSEGQLSLGMHRGPRVAYTPQGIVVSAIVGEQGKGRDGDLLSWRSADEGRRWSGPVRANDVRGSAREGLHAMASGADGTLFAAWLDLRAQGTRVYGATSIDGGATWSANRLVYESPSGTVCQCCHPSVVVSASGIFVMFRNALDGARDLYLSRSVDGGKTFAAARKLGRGTWPLEACPMDGGGLAVDGQNRVHTVWRREDTVYASADEGPETSLGTGRNPATAAGGGGAYAVWGDGKRVVLKAPAAPQPEVVAEDGAFPSIATLDDGSIVVSWEANGTILIDRKDRPEVVRRSPGR
jgi:hypothetical protein